MIRKTVFVLLSTIMFVVFLTAGAADNDELKEFAAAEYAEWVRTDTFQQVINYLGTGEPLNDPFVTSNGLLNISIIDRANCITELSIPGVKITHYWNNVDIKAIEFNFVFDSDPEGQWKMKLSGSQPVARLEITDSNTLFASMVLMAALTGGVTEGYHRTYDYYISSRATDLERIKRALGLLYSEHCTGGESAAF